MSANEIRDALPLQRCFEYLRNSFCSLPWNQESIFGYIGEIVADIVIFNFAVAVAAQLFLLFISLCAHFITFNKMFASFVNEMDNSADVKSEVEMIRKLIEFHMDIKGYVRLNGSQNIIRFYSIENKFICTFAHFSQFLFQMQRRIQLLFWYNIYCE